MPRPSAGREASVADGDRAERAASVPRVWSVAVRASSAAPRVAARLGTRRRLGQTPQTRIVGTVGAGSIGPARPRVGRREHRVEFTLPPAFRSCLGWTRDTRCDRKSGSNGGWPRCGRRGCIARPWRPRSRSSRAETCLGSMRARMTIWDWPRSAFHVKQRREVLTWTTGTLELQRVLRLTGRGAPMVSRIRNRLVRREMRLRGRS
jgi:hypothetical protein